MKKIGCVTRYSLALFLSLGLSLSVQAQTNKWPDKPINMIVGFPAGGPTDLAARTLAPALQAALGQNIIVENKPGATGTIAGALVKRAAADGYTLFVSSIGTFVVAPHLIKSVTYDPIADFDYISLPFQAPNVLVTGPARPERTIAEVLTALKNNPGKLTFASSGVGASDHLSAELLWQQTNTTGVHVPYKGGGPAAADVMAGHVDMYFATVLESLGAVKTGKFTALGVSTLTRSPALPELPTIAESGVPGYDSGSWIGVVAPAGTPVAIIDKVANDMREVIAEPETRQTLIQQGATPLSLSPAAFKARIDNDRQRYSKVIQDANIQIE